MKCHRYFPFLLSIILSPVLSITVRNIFPQQQNEIDVRWKDVAANRLPAGNWATPPPEYGIDLGFTPVQTYLQVRRSNNVQHLPRSEAWKEAVSPDELANAHRLKEVLRTKKVQEVYSEEGFEDLGYDHGHHERQAEHEESFDKHQDGKVKSKSSISSTSASDDSADSESKIDERKDQPVVKNNRFEQTSMEMKYADHPKKKFKRAYKTPLKRKGNNNLVKIPNVPTFGYIHTLTDDFYGRLAVKLPPSRTIPASLFQRRKKREAATQEEEEGKKETENYEKELSEEIDRQKEKILEATFVNLDSSKYADEETDLDLPDAPLTPPKYKAPYKLNSVKYPFFTRKDINPDSPLRYASNSKEFPRKSGFGMEWYEQKDREIKCPDINLEQKEENNTKRINSLGDKIQCLKNKYFGKEPLDSPFFNEPLNKADHYATAFYGYGSPNKTTPHNKANVLVQKKHKEPVVESSEQKPKYEIVEGQQTDNATSQKIEKIELTTQKPKLKSKPIMSLVVLPQKMKKYLQHPSNFITYPNPCIYPVSKMSVTKRSDVFVDCLDVSMVQTTKNGRDHIKIFPKRSKLDLYWLPPTKIRSGEVIEGNHPTSFYRKKRAAEKRSSLFPNRFVLDKITKRVPKNATTSADIAKNATTSADVAKNATTPSPSRNKSKNNAAETTTTIKPHKLTENVTTTTERPRKLSRLSGKTFLDRYHSSKKLGKNDFWTTQSTQTVEPTPMLLYFVDQVTGSGKWVSQMSTEPVVSPFSDRENVTSPSPSPSSSSSSSSTTTTTKTTKNTTNDEQLVVGGKNRKPLPNGRLKNRQP